MHSASTYDAAVPLSGHAMETPLTSAVRTLLIMQSSYLTLAATEMRLIDWLHSVSSTQA